MFEKTVQDLQTLVNDMQKMEKAIVTGETERTRQSVEPMTRLRQNTEEIKEAESNKDVQFVLDRIKDIFG